MIIREITALANMDGFGLPSPISGVLFGGEDQAHKFIIRREDGTAFAGTVTAKFLRYADDVTVPLTGSIEDGAATVTLIENCYMRPGRFKLTVYVTEGESTTAIYCCMGTVDRTDGQQTIDPSGEINLDVTDLINRINTATASVPADYTALLATIAPTFSTSTGYIAGQYVWYNGTLYRFTADHAAGTWTGTDATAAVVGEDVSGLKSAINIINGSENSVELNPAINNRAINGATATFNNGELLMYGKAAGVRWLLCLENQNVIRTSTGSFSETVGKGTYLAKIKVRGYKTTGQVASYTYDTFANRTDIKDGEIFTVNAPVMVGLRCGVYDDYGTIDNPSYVSFELVPIQEKENKSLLKSLKIKYEYGPWSTFTELFSVYVPTLTGYIRYGFRHYVVEEKNCNCWSLYKAYWLDDNLENEIQLTTVAEWECALHLFGRPDFSGGYIHGDEIMQSVLFLIDGKPVDITSYTGVTDCSDVKMVRTSFMFDPADSTTKISDHGVEYSFDKVNGLTITQSVKWAVAEQLTNCYMAMFPPSKNFIDRAIANSDQKTITLATDTSEQTTSVVKHGADKIIMYDTSGAFSAVVTAVVYPKGITGGDSISITDNGDEDYNKAYFKVCGEGASSTINELWKSVVNYALQYKT